MANPVGSENGRKRSLLDETDAVEGRTEQAGNDGFVTPDLIGRLLLPAGKRMPVGAGNDGESRPSAAPLANAPYRPAFHGIMRP